LVNAFSKRKLERMWHRIVPCGLPTAKYWNMSMNGIVAYSVK